MLILEYLNFHMKFPHNIYLQDFWRSLSRKTKIFTSLAYILLIEIYSYFLIFLFVQYASPKSNALFVSAPKKDLL